MLPLRFALFTGLIVPMAAAAQTAVAQVGSSGSPSIGQPSAILPPVGVTATRGPKPIDEVPATVSVIEEQQLERQNAVRPSDIIRYEPGVSVGNQPARGGQTNFVIRGIGGNRVLVLQDGLRIQDFPSSNIGAGNYTRNFVDLETVKRVEILRGPASALYGSDALGGVVNYILKDPSDFLDLTGRDVYVSGKVGYNGSDYSLYETITGAARAGGSEFMLLYTRRDGHQTINMGSPSANPQDYQGNSLLSRLVVRPSDVDTLRITAEYNNLDTYTQVRTEEITTPGSKVFSSRGDDTTQRANIVLDWTHDAPVFFIDSLRTRLSWSQLDRREKSDVYRAVFAGSTPPLSPNRRRISDFGFDQSLWIADVQAVSVVSLLDQNHRLTYGSTFELTDTSRPRDRVEQNLVTGASSTTVAGETYPSKNFPDTRTINVGVYAQDEVSFGSLDLVPAIRFDYYSLKPYPDMAFRRNGGNLTVNPVSEFAISPKFGALYHLSDEYSIYGQYAHGFRAPPYDSSNFGFTNFALGYQILPNADLKSETSNGFEIGVRGKFDRAYFQVNTFYNQYSNFIDTQVVGNRGGLIQYQYRNLPQVRIWGAEAKGEFSLSPEWTLRGAFAWARGEDTQTGSAIDTVDPIRLVTGLHYQSPSGFGADIMLTHGWQHDRVSQATYFKAPAYTVIDLLAHYRVNENLTVNAGIFNLTNTKYFISQDVVGVATNNPSINLYTQPGRYFAMNVTVRW